MTVNNHVDYKNGNYTDVISKLEPNVEKLNTKQTLQLAYSYYMTKNYFKSKILYYQVKKTKDFSDKHKLAMADILLSTNMLELSQKMLVTCKNKSTMEYRLIQQKVIWAEKNQYSFSNAEIAKVENKLTQNFAQYSAYFSKINTRVQMDRKNTIDATDKANYNAMPNLENSVTNKANETKLVKNPFFVSTVNTMYYSTLVTNTRNKKAPKVLTLTCSKMENGQRISNVNLPFCLPDFNYVSPYISGNKLYFSSDKPGGYGGYDLYAIELKNDGQWGAPMNLGSQVNSPGDEMYPTVIDSKLFFSSNGHPGFGGMDIFCALPEGINFGSVLNLGNGINSGYDDFSLIQSETNEYFFLSNRDHLKGFDEIFKAGKFGVDFQPENLSSTH